MQYSIGLIGLAVMGKNLAYNIADRGFPIAVYNRSAEKTREAEAEYAKDTLKGFFSLEEFISALESPKKVMLMVKAGSAVDESIEQLLPLLSAGDVIIDGGNSHYEDTERRTEYLKEKGLLYLGTGVSGGEEGARNGPAIMIGGSKEAYELVKPVFHAISAKADGEDCCGFVGNGGAGHFVKMVHNGIEYADMQLIGESYAILQRLLGLSALELSNVFGQWNTGELESYLISITSEIFKKTDNETGKPLVDLILDKAGQKGTGKWTGQISLELGSPVPAITSAVYDRFLSAKKEERVNASKIYSRTPMLHKADTSLIESVRRALYASKICAYAQGFSMLKDASNTYGWNLNYAQIAKIFRGGCIIRAKFLTELAKEFTLDNNLASILISPYFAKTIQTYEKDWRKVISLAVENGIAAGAFTSSLSYFDNYRSAQMPMNLLQAQRDYFGAHTYERTDKDGIFHTRW
jgi:6-phosphogluconate dehydrogenase